MIHSCEAAALVDPVGRDRRCGFCRGDQSTDHEDEVRCAGASGAFVAVAILRERRARDPGSAGAVFPDSLGGHRDPNNVERDHRRVRQGTPFEWVVPHTYRKTVATLLHQQGLSARTIADQLGHARISMTQDVYMGRRAVDQAAATALEGVSGPHQDGDGEPPAVLAVVVWVAARVSIVTVQGSFSGDGGAKDPAD